MLGMQLLQSYFWPLHDYSTTYTLGAWILFCSLWSHLKYHQTIFEAQPWNTRVASIISFFLYHRNNRNKFKPARSSSYSHVFRWEIETNVGPTHHSRRVNTKPEWSLSVCLSARSTNYSNLLSYFTCNNQRENILYLVWILKQTSNSSVCLDNRGWDNGIASHKVD